MAPRSSNARPILAAVLDAAALGPDPRDAALALFRAGVDWIQLRDRSLEATPLLRLVETIVEARDLANGETKNSYKIVVNRRVDIALSTGADGVQLGFDALLLADAASLLATHALIGVSLHSLNEVEAFARSTLGNDRLYVHLAPIWDPNSKPASRPALGLELLSRACGPGPRILAQGGLDPTRAAQAIRAGASGIAVTGILARSENRLAAARQLRDALDGQTRLER